MTLSRDPENTKDGILVYPAEQCAGYHLLAALLRLGKNCKGLSTRPVDAKEIPACPVVTFDFWQEGPAHWPLKEAELGSSVFVLENEIAGAPMSSEKIERLHAFSEQLRKTHGDIHLVWVLPYDYPRAEIQRLLSLGGKATVFLSPRLFGFRDHSLMDLSLEHRSAPAAWLKKRSEGPLGRGWVSAPDLVGFVISSLQNPSAFGRVVRVPEQVKDYSGWVETFKKYFGDEKSSFFQKLSLPLRPSPLESLPKLPAAPVENAVDADKIFPNPLQTLDRYMKTSAENLQRSPQDPQHFPTRRAI